jgi:hypothetical protein
MTEGQMPETITGILTNVPRRAIAYLLVFVSAELAEIVVPFPRTNTVGNFLAIVFLIGAIALSSFLMLLPLKLRVKNKMARTATWIIGSTVILLPLVVTMIGNDQIAKLSSYVMTSLLMVCFAMVICAIRTSRPDLMRKEEEEERLAGRLQA